MQAFKQNTSQEGSETTEYIKIAMIYFGVCMMIFVFFALGGHKKLK